MNATEMRRALDGIAFRTRQPGPTAKQWVEVLGILAQTTPVPGQYRCVERKGTGSFRVSLQPLPPSLFDFAMRFV